MFLIIESLIISVVGDWGCCREVALASGDYWQHLGDVHQPGESPVPTPVELDLPLCLMDAAPVPV